MGKTSSVDQSASSDSVQDESYVKHGQDVKAGLFLCNPEPTTNGSQAEITQPIVHFPYAYPDPYYNGLFGAYGPHNMVQPQVMAAAVGRVPLPAADLPEDGPIFVNAKQYHGILRRRQTRAKMEAQNKLVKTRKPYLHESRHQHALNRVRGSGGRFLSTKRTQQSDSLPPTSSQGSTPDGFHFSLKINNMESTEHQTGPAKFAGGHVAEGARASTVDAILQQPDDRFSSIPTHMATPMQGNGSLVYSGNRHYASIVR